MKYWRWIILGVWVCVAAPAAQAQDGPGRADGANFSGAPRAGDLVGAATRSGFSLLDPSRLRLNHSYSLSYFSGSGRSGSIGLYMSTLEYQFSRPLSVRIGLGYLHQPLGFLNTSVGSEGGRFLPSVRVDYRPSRNFHFILDYQTLPSTDYRRGYGWGWSAPYSGYIDRPWDW